MRQTEVVIALEERQLLAQPVFALAERGDPTPDGRHMLAEVAVEALHEGGIDLAAKGSQHGLDGLQGAEDHPMGHADQAPLAYGLEHLGIEQPGPWHPARLGGWPSGLAA